MKVTSEIRVYELNGEYTDAKTVQESHMNVLSHWNEKDKVVLTYNGLALTVLAIDLIRSIENAKNWKF